jgi:aspartyl-tRNA(Asn)/glutamyl-tRNA(Gln) amidotransferase subunit A
MISLKEHIKNVQSQEIDIVEHTKQVLDKCEEYNKKYNCFSVITKELALKLAQNLKDNPNETKKKKLAGVFITVKDCICIKDIETHSSSRILKGYKPLFDATVIQKLKSEGAIIIGKTLQDEFGFGTFSTNTGLDFPTPLNPNDTNRATGGSSGGSAVLGKIADFAHVSLGESTGGSIVVPGAFCGINALCPTYGHVSRYGLLDYGNSLDKIGPMGGSTQDIALVMQVIAGYDENESTTINEPVPNYYEEILKSKDKKDKPKIGIIKESLGAGLSSEIRVKFEEFTTKLKSKGFDVQEVSLPTSYKQSLAIYYIIAQSESSTNLAKYCGMRYGMTEELKGNFNDYFSNVRGKHFGAEVKRRIIIGTFVRMIGFRDAYYVKAMKARTKIINEYKSAFKEFDILISPSSPFIAPKFDDIKSMDPLQEYMADILTVGPNLAGIPHMNIPIGEMNKIPIGALVLSDHLNELEILKFSNYIESLEKNVKY